MIRSLLDRFLDAFWLRVDLALYRAHKRRCADCRDGIIRDQLADDINDY